MAASSLSASSSYAAVANRISQGASANDSLSASVKRRRAGVRAVHFSDAKPLFGDMPEGEPRQGWYEANVVSMISTAAQPARASTQWWGNIFHFPSDTWADILPMPEGRTTKVQSSMDSIGLRQYDSIPSRLLLKEVDAKSSSRPKVVGRSSIGSQDWRAVRLLSQRSHSS